MSEQRVVLFPAFAKRASASNEAACPAPDLFGATAAAMKFVFINIALLHEELLFRIMTKNGICGVIDLRDRPIFRMPFFDHQKVFRYFNNRHTTYFEMDHLERRGEADSDEIQDEIRRTLKNGTVLIIFDDEAREESKTERLRRTLRSKFPDAMEIHPNALRS